jgi:xylose isomerase
VREALRASRLDQLALPTVAPGETLADLRADSFDPEEAAARGMALEHLDQLALDHLLGVRG